ncbi:unnamed protein product [Rotaria sp. Silwood2]|nr:unnamed protein product [Rotaria sp. Silwood2]CAF2954023.1 unnamed protein product [Rotaria sp. Silwood2]CAF3241847.1 unnamed protein product [Rotaria sp. Silwood2]CAF3334156.1 unnamed protein product [Rotaria sp. Silwood2]CAF4031551.1 unnamed protein product [Rotaria sp. Silwood2]
MASMNYCLTVCHAVKEEHKQNTQQNASSSPVNIPKSTSHNSGTTFFGNIFSFGSISAASSSILNTSLTSTSLNFTDIDESPY